MTDRTNEEWLHDLCKSPPKNEPAIRELRAFVVSKLHYLLGQGRKRQGHIVEDIAQETIMKVLESIDMFRGESRFTTWASRIAINLAYSELRRLRWRDVSLDVLSADAFSVDPNVLSSRTDSPEERAIKSSMLTTLESTIRTSLTDYQRQVLVAILNTEMPIGEVARRFGTNRNALYKVLHDARKKLKRALLDAGLTAEDVRSAL